MSGPGRGSGTCRVLEAGSSWVYLRNRKDNVDGKERMGEEWDVMRWKRWAGPDHIGCCGGAFGF